MAETLSTQANPEQHIVGRLKQTVQRVVRWLTVPLTRIMLRNLVSQYPLVTRRNQLVPVQT
jgi:hypothetical protein